MQDEHFVNAPNWMVEVEKVGFLLAIFAELNMQGRMQVSHIEVLHDQLDKVLIKLDELVKAIREA